LYRSETSAEYGTYCIDNNLHIVKSQNIPIIISFCVFAKLNYFDALPFSGSGAGCFLTQCLWACSTTCPLLPRAQAFQLSYPRVFTLDAFSHVHYGSVFKA
jgi:hypothetical protein